MHADLSTALLNVLMYFPCQEARGLASEMLAYRNVTQYKLLRIVLLAEQEDWHNTQVIEILRKHAEIVSARKKPVARRVTRKDCSK